MGECWGDRGFKDLGVQLFWTVGVHTKVEGLWVGDKWRDEWRERVHDKRCVAVWEAGLDGNGSGRPREWVVLGSLLALDTGKPMVIHCRRY